MKNRKLRMSLFITFLLALCLLAGCANKENTATEELTQEMPAGEAEERTEAGKSEGAAETGEAEGTEDAEDAEDAQAQEPYILNFTATTIEGEQMTSDILGESKLTMLNVWATYCNPCLSEMPDLGELAAAYDSAEFQVMGIISDVAEGATEAELENARNLIAQTGAAYPHLLLNESLYSNLVGAVDAVPTTFFVNSEGELLGYVVGARAKADWEEIINELLAELEK